MKIPGLSEALADLQDLPEKTDAMVDKLDRIIALMEQIERNTRNGSSSAKYDPNDPWPGGE